jgi:hypothetical protein
MERKRDDDDIIKEKKNGDSFTRVLRQVGSTKPKVSQYA